MFKGAFRKSLDRFEQNRSMTTTHSLKGVKDTAESHRQFNIITGKNQRVELKQNSILGFKDKAANVIDMNINTQFPSNLNRKKNKNDFYRFLLNQNLNTESGVGFHNPDYKINNDILIPRSILKKNDNPPMKEENVEEIYDIDGFEDYGTEDLGDMVVGKKI